MTKTISFPFKGDFSVEINNLDTRITNLESNDTIYQVFQFTGTTQTGTITIPQEATIYDLYQDGVVDQIVVKASPEGSPIDELVKTASGQTVTVTSLDQNGNYVLSGAPSVNACLVYFIAIQDKYKENVPLSTIVDHIDIDFITQINNLKIDLATLEGNGVVSGMKLSINTDTTKFNVASGVYHIIEGGDVTYAGLSGISVPTLTTANSTYVGLNINGTVVQQLEKFTPTQRRSIIPLGLLIHSNRTVLNTVNNLPEVAKNLHSQYYDLLCSLNTFNTSGNIFSPNGANMFVNKSLGSIFKKGVNFENDFLNPHIKELIALVAPTTIRYRTSGGLETPDTQSILTKYETGGIIQDIPSSRFAIQRIYLFPTNLIRIQPGTVTYNSSALAIQSITSELFTPEANIAQNGLLRGYLILKGSTISLLNTDDAIFIEADKWGSMPLGSSGGTTSLQQAYNNSATPEIITSTGLGALSIKNGESTDTINVLEVQNIAGQNKAEIKGDGTARFGDVVGGNYTEIEPDGTIVGKGLALTFRDELPTYITAVAGAPAPDLVTHTIGGVSRYLWSFDGGTQQEILSGSFEIPHDYAYGQPIEVHIHVRPATTGTGRAVFYFDWEHSPAQSAPIAKTSLVTGGVHLTIATNKQYWHLLESFGNLPDSGFMLGDKIGFTLRRNPADVLDTYAGDILFEQIALHVPCDTLGSRQIYIK